MLKNKNILAAARALVLSGVSILFIGCAQIAPKESAQHPDQNHGFSSKQASSAEWWNIPYPVSFDPKTLAKPQSFIAVKGNGFITEAGKPFIFRGVNIADPDKLSGQGRWTKALFTEIHNWGANTVRIPVHPMAWRKNGRDWYLKKLDEAVYWANSLDMYIIIDWHSIGNLEGGLYQHPMYDTTKAETTQFWQAMALHYKNVPTMAVYELFNEPTDNYIGAGQGSLGKAPWEAYRNTIEDLIDLIYVYDNKVVPLVAGFNWGYDLRPIAKQPIRREGIAYTAHPYPQKAKPEVKTRENYFAAWEEVWGYVAKQYPVMATEIGWVKEDGYGAHVPVIDNDGIYGPNIVAYMQKMGVSYTVWTFDPDWPPTMISDWDFTPTEQGQFFKEAMQAAKAREAKQ